VGGGEEEQISPAWLASYLVSYVRFSAESLYVIRSVVPMLPFAFLSYRYIFLNINAHEVNDKIEAKSAKLRLWIPFFQMQIPTTKE
jgi:hypothetical protein